jgi:hypothetical protein
LHNNIFVNVLILNFLVTSFFVFFSEFFLECIESIFNIFNKVKFENFHLKKVD